MQVTDWESIVYNHDNTVMSQNACIEYEGCKRGQRRGTSQQQQASGEEVADLKEEATDWEEVLGVAGWEEVLGAAGWGDEGGKDQKRTMMFSGRKVAQL